MKIKVRSEETSINLPIPTGLLLNPFIASLLPRLLADYGIHVTKHQAFRLVSAVNRFRRHHKDWVLVEVDSASGEQIMIKL